jgi:hypothetical protein
MSVTLLTTAETDRMRTSVVSGLYFVFHLIGIDVVPLANTPSVYTVVYFPA